MLLKQVCLSKLPAREPFQCSPGGDRSQHDRGKQLVLLKHMCMFGPEQEFLQCSTTSTAMGSQVSAGEGLTKVTWPAALAVAAASMKENSSLCCSNSPRCTLSKMKRVV